MKHIRNLIQEYMHSKSKEKKPAHERAYWVQKICDDIFSNPNSQVEFKKILGQTKHLSIDEMKAIYSQSKSWETNPPALFWKLIKESRKKN